MEGGHDDLSPLGLEAFNGFFNFRTAKMVGCVDADFQSPGRGIQKSLTVSACGDSQVFQNLPRLRQAGFSVVQTVVIGQSDGLHAALRQNLAVGGQAPEPVFLFRRNRIGSQGTLQIHKGEIIPAEQLLYPGKGIGVVLSHHIRKAAAFAPGGMLYAQGAVSGKAQEKSVIRQRVRFLLDRLSLGEGNDFYGCIIGSAVRSWDCRRGRVKKTAGPYGARYRKNRHCCRHGARQEPPGALGRAQPFAAPGSSSAAGEPLASAAV